MKAFSFNVCGIGNALVDILAEVDDAFLAQHNQAKGRMQLVDQPQMKALYQHVGPAVEMSGGSGANTMSGVVAMGGKAAYIGKVAEDQLGDVFRHDSQTVGVHFNSAPHVGELSTGCCLVLVTPDGERTMNTYLGASQALGLDDIDAPLIADSAVTYLEGYLFDPPAAKQGFYQAAELAHAAGREVAMTLSDVFCVERYRADFLDLLGKHIDIVFANIHEAEALFQTKDLAQIMAGFRQHSQLTIVTRGAEDTLVITPQNTIHAPINPVEKVVDATGAGDLYAAGFLYGYTQGMPLETCAKHGATAAAAIIQQVGARLPKNLKLAA